MRLVADAGRVYAAVVRHVGGGLGGEGRGEGVGGEGREMEGSGCQLKGREEKNG